MSHRLILPPAGNEAALRVMPGWRVLRDAEAREGLHCSHRSIPVTCLHGRLPLCQAAPSAVSACYTTKPCQQPSEKSRFPLYGSWERAPASRGLAQGRRARGDRVAFSAAIGCPSRPLTCHAGPPLLRSRGKCADKTESLGSHLILRPRVAALLLTGASVFSSNSKLRFRSATVLNTCTWDARRSTVLERKDTFLGQELLCGCRFTALKREGIPESQRPGT